MDTNKNTETNGANHRNGQWETTGEQTDELTPKSTGRWMITTRGTQHVWELNKMTYIRMPSAASKTGSMGHDHRPVSLTRVVCWPKVGARPYFWYDDPEYPMFWEHWRISSEVQKIERLSDLDKFTPEEQA